MKRSYFCIFTIILISVLFQTAFGQEVKTERDLGAKVLPQSTDSENVKNIAQYVLAMKDTNISAVSIAQIADLIWTGDDEYARSLFIISLDKLLVKEADSEKEIYSKNAAYRKVVSLIAKRDPNWTKELVKMFAKESNKRAKTNLEIANNLLESDPKLAADFANQSVQIEITENLVWFLKKLRQQNEAEANRLFVNILSRYPQQANVDVNQFAVLGTYLFTSPQISPQDFQTIAITRVGNFGMPNITVNLPNASPSLIQSYIKSAIFTINRPTSNSQQRQMKYALGYLLLPKAQEFAPNLVGELGGAMAALTSVVPSEITSEEAYKNINKKTFATPEERIEEIEKIADSYTRDQLFLDVAFHAWQKNDFLNAKLAASKIENKDVRGKLEILILFGETNHLLKDKQVNLFQAIQMTEKLPVSLEKSQLWLGIASIAEKTRQPAVKADALESAFNIAKRLNDENTPFLLLYISGQMKKNDPSQSSAVLTESIKSFNKSENIKNPLLLHKVILEPLTLPFSLAVKDVNLDFQNSFQKAINGDEQNGVQIVDAIKDERLKGQAYVSLVKSILAKKPINAFVNNQETVVKVGEDGIRKSAAKRVMPVYPEESRKQQAKGVAVAEVQYNGNGDVTDIKVLESPDSHIGKTVGDALKQWKFKPSQLDGKPISVRGKITFYFVIDPKGKGEVKNPKQFQ